ncbi:MAG: hypothetical protein RL211_2166 [Pseudomonadota bacterium]|jgi:16S rRNA (guanine(966)-N(2))-methyltransferase RsmD
MKPKNKSASNTGASRKPVVKRPAKALTNEVRIIGGQWKRTKLPVANKPGLRPTPDRVRETLFNWLGQDLTGWRCFDAFAGTGALGFEAASRGAVDVQVVEHDPYLVAQLKTIQAKLQASAVHVQRGDGVVMLKHASPASLDLIFLDPPFEGGLFSPALQAAGRAVKPEGFVYLEAPAAYTDEALQPFGLKSLRQLKAGAVHAHLLAASSTPADSGAA